MCSLKLKLALFLLLFATNNCLSYIRNHCLMKKLAVYILTYNRSNFLTEALNSILQQTYSDFDLFVSDNSTNNLTQSLVQNHPEKDRLTYIRRSPSRSAIFHFNEVLTEAKKYPYFMLFHDDDILNTEAIEKIMSHLEAHESYSAIGCNSLILKSEVRSTIPFNPNFHSDQIISSSYDLLNHYLTKNLSHIPFPFYIYRTQKIKELVFDEKKGGKHCDVSFLAEAADCGPIYWINQPLAQYRQHANNDSSSIDLHALVSLSKYITQKHPSLFLKSLLMLVKLAATKFKKDLTSAWTT